MSSDALFPFPDGVRKKILQLDFVDMSELVPEAWTSDDGSGQDKGLAPLFRKRKEPVTDPLVWAQCFAAMTAVLAERYPQHVPQLMVT